MGTDFDGIAPEILDRAFPAELPVGKPLKILTAKTASGISVGNGRLDLTASRGLGACDCCCHSPL